MDDLNKIRKIEDWDGNEERLNIESRYEFLYDFNDFHFKENYNQKIEKNITNSDYRAEKDDYLLASAIGLITGMIDVLWIGEFSLDNASSWGSDKVNCFVIFVAKQNGFNGEDLKGAILYLEKEAKIPSDSLTYDFGGGKKHHFRDFAHHPSIVGLIFSLLTQFTKKCYGVDENGEFKVFSLENDSFIGKNNYSKVIIGLIKWFLHLVSDMAGSSNTPGRGVGIPGPILSLASEIVSLLHLNELNVDSKKLYQQLENIFEGKNNDAKTKFDLRTEIGIFAELTKQSMPVYINRGLIKATYIIKYFIKYIKDNDIDRVDLCSITNYYSSIKWNSQCYIRMCTISSGIFTAIDVSDAFIRNKILDNKNAIGILFRINIVGIMSFLIAIKNDITYNVKEYLLNKGKLLSTSQELEIRPIYDTNEFYNYRCDIICKNVVESKRKAIKDQDMFSKFERPILSYRDKATLIFNEVTKNSNALAEIERLIMSLLKHKKIPFVSCDERNIALYNKPFYRVENGKKVLYYFTWSIFYNDYEEFRKDLKEFDMIIIIALVELGDNTKWVEEEFKYEDAKNGVEGQIVRKTIKAFFMHFFGKEEFLKFQYEINKLNNNIHSLIGYSTIEIPTPTTLTTFKIRCNSIISNYDYKEAFASIYNVQYQLIIDNYIKNDKYLCIIGDSNFAKSFISSEWYYNQFNQVDGIEQTAIVAGYFKSIEQLLYAILKFSVNTGYKIKRKIDKELIECTQQNLDEDKIDLSFGSMINYFAHNYSIWSVNKYVKKYIVDKLNLYREKYRNDHFHKDNIFIFDEIKEIRRATIELYCLLLGGMKINSKDLMSLNEDNKIEYMDCFNDWLDKLIGGNNLIDPKIGLLFWVQNKEIMLCTYDKYDNEEELDVKKMDYPFFNNYFNFVPKDYNYIVTSIQKWIHNYLNEGKYSSIFSYHQNILLYYAPNELVVIK